MTEAFQISVKGTAAADQLWAMARDGKSLLEMGDYLMRQYPDLTVFEDDPSSSGIQYAVILLAASMGVVMTG